MQKIEIIQYFLQLNKFVVITFGMEIINIVSVLILMAMAYPILGIRYIQVEEHWNTIHLTIAKIMWYDWHIAHN